MHEIDRLEREKLHLQTQQKQLTQDHYSKLNKKLELESFFTECLGSCEKKILKTLTSGSFSVLELEFPLRPGSYFLGYFLPQYCTIRRKQKYKSKSPQRGESRCIINKRRLTTGYWLQVTDDWLLMTGD